MAPWSLTTSPPLCPTPIPQDVRTAYFGSSGGGLRGASRSPSSSITLEWLWERCAYNAITFKAAHNLVVSVSLPCAGTRDNGAPFNGAAACGVNELLGWSEAATAAAQVGAPRTSVHGRAARRARECSRMPCGWPPGRNSASMLVTNHLLVQWRG